MPGTIDKFQFKATWPPSGLSPNSRTFWAKKLKIKRQYQALVEADIIEALHGRRDHVPYFGRAVMDLLFVPPIRRPYDIDNCIARFKAGIDVLGPGNKNNRGVIVTPGLRIVDDDDLDHLKIGSVDIEYRTPSQKPHVLVTLRRLS